MHELSIAQSVVEMATDAAQAAGAIGVQSVRLRIGALSGVVEDALHFSWEIVTAETLLAGAQLVVEEAPVVIYCATCQANQTPESTQWLRCPICGAPPAQIVQGRDLELLAVEIIIEDAEKSDFAAHPGAWGRGPVPEGAPNPGAHWI